MNDDTKIVVAVSEGIRAFFATRMRCEVCGKIVADDGSDGHFHDVPTFDGSEV